MAFRAFEAIRRHDYLWKATHPALWVDHLRTTTVRYARAIAADAVVDDAWVDREPGPALSRVFEECWQRPPRAHRSALGSPAVFTDAVCDAADEAAQRDARFRRSFGFAPDELDFAILWGIAGAVEHQFLDRYCAEQGWAVSTRSARKARERLQQALRSEREELDRAEPANAEIAPRFPSDVLPGEPDPLAELSWPGIARVRALRYDAQTLRLAFLEPGAWPRWIASSQSSRAAIAKPP